MVSATSSKMTVKPVDAFASAVQSLAQKLGATATDDPTPISEFKANYGGLLSAARSGRVQQISRGGERYVVLTEEQVIAIARFSSSRHSLADTLASIRAPTMILEASSVMVPGQNHEQYVLNASAS